MSSDFEGTYGTGDDDGYTDHPAFPILGTFLPEVIGVQRLSDELAAQFTPGPVKMFHVSMTGLLVGIPVPDDAKAAIGIGATIQTFAELVAQIVVCVEHAGAMPAYQAMLDREIVAARNARVGDDIRHE